MADQGVIREFIEYGQDPGAAFLMEVHCVPLLDQTQSNSSSNKNWMTKALWDKILSYTNAFAEDSRRRRAQAEADGCKAAPALKPEPEVIRARIFKKKSALKSALF